MQQWCMGGVQEVVGINAERLNVQEVHGRCAGDGGDKCRKVKCAEGVQEVHGRCVGGGGNRYRKVKCM